MSELPVIRPEQTPLGYAREVSLSLNHPEALIGVALGIEAIVVGMARKGDFHALGPGQRPTPGTKTIPRWLGRLWFFGWGCVVLYWCVPRLLGRWYWRELWADWWIAVFVVIVWLLKKLRDSQAEKPDAEHEQDCADC